MTKSLASPKSFHYKASRIGEENEDVFSKLPEEILLSIISSFTMKETARLSLVSRQWEFIWRRVPLLIFEDSQAMDKIQRSWDPVVEERSNFVRRVDRVLEQHLETVIDELKITFDLDHNWQSHVDKWAAFGVDKQVKRLELNFSSRWRGSFLSCNGIDWPICGDPLDLPPKLTSIKPSLTSLCLKYVNVTDDFIDYLSHSCPLLENLCVVGSKCLTRVSGSFDKVKHLEVSRCSNLNTIDISAPKLGSFVHDSQRIDLHIASASSLLEVSIGKRDRFYSIAYALDSLSDYLSQLVYLRLMICLFSQMNLGINNPAAMPNLQHLELHVIAETEQSLRGWTSFIAASPSLQKLTFKLNSNYTEQFDWPASKWVGFPLKCFKTLELIGYVGRKIDLELAFFVIENASMLQEVIVDFLPPNYSMLYDDDVRERLVKLQEKLPHSVKLTVK